jgi:Zn-dependent peptidase ImmA (M78 family)/DNA-binding XRE family transcriptional regulator
MSHFPERLKSARLMNGLSLEGLAERLQHRVSRQALYKYEQGDMNPDDSLLPHLCRTLQVPPDYFYRESTVDLGNIFFRKLEKLTATEQKIAIEKTRDFLERYLELESLLGVHVELENPVEGKKPNDLVEVENLALEVREKFNLGHDPFSNVIELLEGLGIRVLEIKLHEDFSGMSTWVDGKTPVIVVNNVLDKKLYRKRFTVLHELGHLFLDIQDFPEKEQERFCDAFAGALLLPAESLKEKIGDSRRNLLDRELLLLKQEFGISVRAVLFRAKQSGIISEYEFKEHMIALSRRYGKKDEPGDYIGSEQANRFWHLLYRALAEEVISESKAAALAGMRLAEFRDKIKVVK